MIGLAQSPSKLKVINRFFKKSSVLVSVCTHRKIDIDCVTNLMQLFGSNKHSITWSPIVGDALIDRARSRVATFFLKQRDEEILFFVDDDVRFTKEDFIKVVDDVVDGRDIVAGMYVQKVPSAAKNCVTMNNESITFSKDGKCQEVQCANTGFMAIHRRVLEKMAKEKAVPFCSDLEFYPFFAPFPKQLEDGRWIYLSEDWAFCTRARALGFKVFIDTSIMLGHIGDYEYDLRDRFRNEKIEWEKFDSVTF